MPAAHDHFDAPSAWVTRWAYLLPGASRVLDVACGHGRHARWFAARGHAVDAVDRNADALAALAAVLHVTPRCADIEAAPWPYAPGVYGCVVVTNYLHRALFPHLLDALAPGGVLIYETFALGNERFGRPSNPEFLLKPGELLETVRGHLAVHAYEDLIIKAPRAARVQRICALRATIPG
jgi:SAM-dependent methyltransferase